MVSMTNESLSSTDINKISPWRRAFMILAVVFASLGLVAGGAIGGQLINQSSEPQSALTAGEDGNKTATKEESTIAAVAEKVSPSVVSVITASQSRSYYGTASQEGAGTGIIISSDGYILTNNHVIDGASSVTVIDANGDTYSGVTVIGRDPLNDVAFLKITSDTTFTAAEIGDSSTLRIGQQVVAIGNALGQYKNTVTSGIISGTGRPVTASTGSGQTESLIDLLQTDASINSGNSGGPLLNLAGQVIGINTAVATDANGIGFAIPINSTKGVMAGVLQNGTISRSYLGVNFLSITPEVVREYKLSVRAGAYVSAQRGSAIVTGSPADKAGIKDGDIIQKIDSYVVGDNGGLSSIIGQYQPGDSATLTIVRDGQVITKEITFGAYSQ